jgi:hypothetical protein
MIANVIKTYLMRGEQVESIHQTNAEAIYPDGVAAYAAGFAASPIDRLRCQALSGSRVGVPLIGPWRAGNRVRFAGPRVTAVVSVLQEM